MTLLKHWNDFFVGGGATDGDRPPIPNQEVITNQNFVHSSLPILQNRGRSNH
ncbi:MAG: hypothetical protein U7127_29640 [Phormidium sp.]